MLKIAGFVGMYFLHKLKSFRKNFIKIYTTNNKFYTFLSGCNVIKIELIIKQDGG